MSMVFVPHDTAAVALGANKIAAALQQAGATVVRTGSRGALWLEPMVEVATPGGRIAYGPVTPADLPGLLAADLFTGGAHRLRLGPPANLPFLAAQRRLVFARCGITDPLSISEYEAHGGLKGLRRAFEIGPQETIAAVSMAELRGRGGSGFPTGVKWRTADQAAGPRKFIVCNADEGDSGTFADRMLMEGDPLTLIEGMVIASLRDRRFQGLCLHPLGIPGRHSRLQRSPRRRPHGQAARHQHPWLRLCLRHRAGCRRRRLRLRRRNLPARQPGG